MCLCAPLHDKQSERVVTMHIKNWIWLKQPSSDGLSLFPFVDSPVPNISRKPHSQCAQQKCWHKDENNTNKNRKIVYKQCTNVLTHARVVRFESTSLLPFANQSISKHIVCDLFVLDSAFQRAMEYIVCNFISSMNHANVRTQQTISLGTQIGSVCGKNRKLEWKEAEE